VASRRLRRWLPGLAALAILLGATGLLQFSLDPTATFWVFASIALSLGILSLLSGWAARSLAHADRLQRQAEAALENSLAHLGGSEARFRMITERANDAILLMDRAGRIVEANVAAESLFARSRDELLGQAYRAFVAREDRSESDAALMTILAGGSVRIENRRVVRPDGTTLAVEVSSSMVPLGPQANALCILRDVTERLRGEATLRARGEQYRLLFEGNPHPMWVCDDVTEAFLTVNDSAVRHYGYSHAEFLAMTTVDLWHELVDEPREEHPGCRPQPPGSAAPARLQRHRKRDGTLIDVEVWASPINFEGRHARLVLANDVSDRLQLQARFLHAQKMETVGQLAGGIAHDFNNLLGVIVGYGEMLSRGLPEEPVKFHRYVREILEAAARAGGLTRQLLAFSRRQVLQPQVMDLNAVVTKLLTMLKPLVGEHIKVVTRLREDVGLVKSDPGQIEQILMNLVVNSRDAMPQGGNLTIETGKILLDGEYAALHPEVLPGPYVFLSVGDDGTGIPAAVRERIFEPFFTTKEPGKGTGLGLATVHGIVKQSGGHIVASSEPGRGALFQVYLPAWQVGVGPEPIDMGDGDVLRGSETVLVVEDEIALRNVLRESLEGLGYRVLCAENGEQALALEAAETIDFLLTDIVMPEMSGRELAERLLARRPELRVLYMSGYTDDEVVRSGILTEQVAFLAKPFTLPNLAKKVRAVLEA
jgi:two-component system, cell cycle sensor histidine kinase and response regulator CckA